MRLQLALAILLVGIVSRSSATFFYQICERPADPANGKVVDRFGGVFYFEPGDKVWFRCDKGFVLQGAKDFVCQRNGNWRPQPFPKCVRQVVVQQCRRPADPQNGDVVSRNKNQVLFKAGEKVWFKCDNGFNLVGAKDFVCQRNGNWLPQPFPRCVRRVQQCRRPADPQNGDVVSRGKNQVLFKTGEKVWFKCDNGFVLQGAKDFVCQRNGNWLPQPFPKCVRRVQQCRRPADPRNGDVVSRGKNQRLFNVGQKVWFKCDKGFVLKGAKDFVCQRNGNWLPQPFPTCVRQAPQCTLPRAPANGGIITLKKNQRVFNPGQKIWFRCNRGFVLRGAKDFVCQRNGSWRPQPFPTCARKH